MYNLGIKAFFEVFKVLGRLGIKPKDVIGMGGDIVKMGKSLFNTRINPKLITFIEKNQKIPTKIIEDLKLHARTLKNVTESQKNLFLENIKSIQKAKSVKIPKSSAKLSSKFDVSITSESPDWAESYTFYVKETANEYYNLSMDRWYNAEDGGIWLSFPSSERNKVKEGGVLILKKQHGNDKAVEADVKYKVLDIKNNAPEFIKEETQYWGVLPMMLPPPGWGVGGRVGGWDSGMFHPTGLPLPDRLYLDIYAEYFDQSVLAGLTSKDNAEVRMIQSQSTPSSYNAWSSNSINKSNWYGVANVNYIGAPAETYTETTEVNGVDVKKEIEVPGQAEQLVRLSLEKLMGQDMAFCEPKDDLSIARGLSLEARTKTKRNKAQFEGRFFAKIHRDSNG